VLEKREIHINTLILGKQRMVGLTVTAVGLAKKVSSEPMYKNDVFAVLDDCHFPEEKDSGTIGELTLISKGETQLDCVFCTLAAFRITPYDHLILAIPASPDNPAIDEFLKLLGVEIHKRIIIEDILPNPILGMFKEGVKIIQRHGLHPVEEEE
jgi:hypothetical protein